MRSIAMYLAIGSLMVAGGCQPVREAQRSVDDLPQWRDQADWQSYKECFLHPDGRILDTGNGDISHSEGQGYGMILATAADDTATFHRLWHWTQENLQIRGEDDLLAWRWEPGSPHVSDTNNASDGDLLVAWALLRAAAIWQRPDYRAQAERLLTDLAEHAVKPGEQGPVLLPAAFGFELDEGYELNLAYWVYPALLHAAWIQPEGPWKALYHHGLELTQASLRGPHSLPPDWIGYSPESGRVELSERHDPVFGFEAIRMPLYQCWAGGCNTALWRGVSQWWQSGEAPAAWADVTDRKKVAPYAISVGGQSIRQLLLKGSEAEFEPLSCDGPEGEDYYSASLNLLSRLALRERDIFRP